jgi:hypothetical protein
VDGAAVGDFDEAAAVLIVERALDVDLATDAAWNVPDFIDTGLGCQVGEFPES